MRAALEIAGTGFTAVRLHPLRSGVTVGAVVAVLLPYLACLGLSQGLREQAEASVRLGADVCVTAQQYGRPVPIPLSAIDDLRRIPGVADVEPRIIGAIVLGKEQEGAVVVGLPRTRLSATVHCVEGRLTEGSALNELVVGTELARRLRLKVGSRIPPFYHSAPGERISCVVGVFKPDAGVWQANLIVTSIETAAHLFDQDETATELLVWCRPGYEAQVASAARTLALRELNGRAHLDIHVVGRTQAAAILDSSLLYRDGIFQLHFVLALAVAILVVLVTSGFGLPGRRREIGILKATGWQTDEVLLRCAAESFLLALLAVALTIVLAFVWLKWLNGLGVAGLFITGVDAAPSFVVPSRLTPVPVLLAALVGFIVVLTGNVVSAWRAATVPPAEAMR